MKLLLNSLIINHFCEVCDETDQGWACRGSYFTERYNQFTANLVQSQAPKLQKLRAQIKTECGSSTIQRQQWLDAVSEVACAASNPMKNPAPKCKQLIQDCTSLLGQQLDAFMDAQGASCKKSEDDWTCGGQNFFKDFGELTNNYIYNQDRDPKALEGTFKTFRKMQDEVVAGCEASMNQIMENIQDKLSPDLDHQPPWQLSPKTGNK